MVALVAGCGRIGYEPVDLADLAVAATSSTSGLGGSGGAGTFGVGGAGMGGFAGGGPGGGVAVGGGAGMGGAGIDGGPEVGGGGGPEGGIEAGGCLPPRTMCGADCVLTDLNPTHCGQCNNPCPPDVGCSVGQCTVVEAQDVIALVNQFRVAAGCPALATDPRLMASAQFLSEDMAYRDFIDDNQVASDGSTVPDRMTREGYIPDGWGELNAWVYATPNDAVTFWQNNAAYRRQLLRCTLQHIGVGHVYQANDQPNVMHNGVAQGPFFHYWTADFASLPP
jgi:uncharacterized protein YkwD